MPDNQTTAEPAARECRNCASWEARMPPIDRIAQPHGECAHEDARADLAHNFEGYAGEIFTYAGFCCEFWSERA